MDPDSHQQDSGWDKDAQHNSAHSTVYDVPSYHSPIDSLARHGGQHDHQVLAVPLRLHY